MKLDERTLQELYKVGILTKTGVRRINIVNYYQNNAREFGKYGAVKATAAKFGISRQRVWQILKGIT